MNFFSWIVSFTQNPVLQMRLYDTLHMFKRVELFFSCILSIFL